MPRSFGGGYEPPPPWWYPERPATPPPPEPEYDTDLANTDTPPGPGVPSDLPPWAAQPPRPEAAPAPASVSPADTLAPAAAPPRKPLSEPTAGAVTAPPQSMPCTAPLPEAEPEETASEETASGVATSASPDPPAHDPVTPAVPRADITQLAVCWAIDYASFDEDQPARRAAALARYLAQPSEEEEVGGWSGHGRQRATFAVAGRSRLDDIDPTVTWVNVKVLVTPYEPRPLRPVVAAASRSSRPGDQPSAAPAPEATGWRPLDSFWMTVVTAVREDPRAGLVIDPDYDQAQLDVDLVLDDPPPDVASATRAL